MYFGGHFFFTFTLFKKQTEQVISTPSLLSSLSPYPILASSPYHNIPLSPYSLIHFFFTFTLFKNRLAGWSR